ncbi:helix-turn-helix domain-containing protein [Microbispora sp. CA-135349]|uniref:helix-turn-helix domain-containing protein n=1 Tax=Microbispora sp. CA-135349 TaxID=3239953 RepID=UPI003D90E6E9
MDGERRDGFGGVLLALRRAGRLTQEELAEASGLSVRAIRELERGRVRVPQRRTASALADALGLVSEDRDRLLAAARAGRPAPAPCPPSRSPEPPMCPVPAPPSAPVGPARPEASGAAPGAPAELPVPLGDLVGREAQAAYVREHASRVAAGDRRGAPILTFHGPPGVGKTSLAVYAGDRVRAAFPDGQLFAELGGTAAEPLDPAEALGAFLRSLGTPEERIPPGTAERAGLFRTLTRGLRLLVVLDDAAHEGQVRPLLPAGPHCLALVTGRRPLTGLDGAARIALDVLAPGDSVRLLGGIVGHERVEREPAQARRLAELCGHLPLALRIAGDRLAGRPGWRVGHLTGWLGDHRHRLTALTAGDLEVRSAFDVSYRRLGPGAAAVFRHAALIPGPDFGAESAAAAAGVAVPDALAALEELADAGLLSTTGTRYRFHDLLRLYARERLDAEDRHSHGPRPAHSRLRETAGLRWQRSATSA